MGQKQSAIESTKASNYTNHQLTGSNQTGTKKNMKKTSTNDDMLVEYDFDYKKAKPNRFIAEGSPEQYLIELDPDVAEVFKSSEAVNQVLRAIMQAMPKAA